MARRSKSKNLAVWMNGEKVGDWNIDAQGQHEFRYEQGWVDAAPQVLTEDHIEAGTCH